MEPIPLKYKKTSHKYLWIYGYRTQRERNVALFTLSNTCTNCIVHKETIHYISTDLLHHRINNAVNVILNFDKKSTTEIYSYPLHTRIIRQLPSLFVSPCLSVVLRARRELTAGWQVCGDARSWHHFPLQPQLTAVSTKLVFSNSAETSSQEVMRAAIN